MEEFIRQQWHPMRYYTVRDIACHICSSLKLCSNWRFGCVCEVLPLNLSVFHSRPLWHRFTYPQYDLAPNHRHMLSNPLTCFVAWSFLLFLLCLSDVFHHHMYILLLVFAFLIFHHVVFCFPLLFLGPITYYWQYVVEWCVTISLISALGYVQRIQASPSHLPHYWYLPLNVIF